MRPDSHFNAFSKIALCLSGGGFRSAAYSLGVIKYLNLIGILPAVRSISTVSGGSITGIKYVLFLASGKVDFEEFYAEMMDFFRKNNVHNRAIEILNDPLIWQRPTYCHKERNLINSFSIAYDEWLNGATLGDLDLSRSRFEEYIFNATDMNNAIQFRFKNTGKFGNGFMKTLKTKDKNLIKLGDVMAASTCFPGGFEPINFPDDFLPHLKQQYSNVSLMDGGIIDNQGTINYQSKLENSQILIVDVQSKVLSNPYKPSQNSQFITLFSLITSFWSVLILGLCALFFRIADYPILTVIFGVSLIMVSLVQLGIYHLLKRAQEKFGLKAWLSFHPKRYAIYLANRLTSFNSLAQHIFLKNNRDRSFKSLYRFTYKKGQPRVPMLLPLYRLTSAEESKVDHWEELLERFPDLIPNDNIYQCIHQAVGFPTTLWFKEETKESDLNALIKAGEMTACYSLLCYVLQEVVAGRMNLEDVPFYQKMQENWKSYKIKS